MANENKYTGGLQVFNDPVVKYVTLGIGLVVVGKAFGVLDKVLEALGFQDSAAKRHLDESAGNAASFWTPTFWQNSPTGALLLTSAAAEQDVSDIYSAIGWFNDDEDAVKGVFRRLKTQSQVSYLADYFEKKYHQDLLSFLRGGNWPQDRLSDADVNELDAFVSSLPKYFLK